MTSAPGPATPEISPQVVISGLGHVDPGTLIAITNQLRNGSKLWRYSKLARDNLLRFADIFEGELKRRGRPGLPK
jgi:hypothetical protein